jgi:hypothetical protein
MSTLIHISLEWKTSIVGYTKYDFIRHVVNFNYRTCANKGRGFYSRIIFSALHNGTSCQNSV